MFENRWEENDENCISFYVSFVCLQPPYWITKEAHAQYRKPTRRVESTCRFLLFSTNFSLSVYLYYSFKSWLLSDMFLLFYEFSKLHSKITEIYWKCSKTRGDWSTPWLCNYSISNFYQLLFSLSATCESNISRFGNIRFNTSCLVLPGCYMDTLLNGQKNLYKIYCFIRSILHWKLNENHI